MVFSYYRVVGEKGCSCFRMDAFHILLELGNSLDFLHLVDNSKLGTEDELLVAERHSRGGGRGLRDGRRSRRSRQGWVSIFQVPMIGPVIGHDLVFIILVRASRIRRGEGSDGGHLPRGGCRLGSANTGDLLGDGRGGPIVTGCTSSPGRRAGLGLDRVEAVLAQGDRNGCVDPSRGSSRGSLDIGSVA